MTHAAGAASGPRVRPRVTDKALRLAMPPPGACTWGVRLRRTSQLLVLPEVSVLQAEPVPREEPGQQGCGESDSSSQCPPVSPHGRSMGRTCAPSLSQPLETNPESQSLQTPGTRMWRQRLENCLEVLVSSSAPLPHSFIINALKSHLLRKMKQTCRAGFTLGFLNALCTRLVPAVQLGAGRSLQSCNLGWGGALTLGIETLMLIDRASPRAQCGPSVGAETARWDLLAPNKAVCASTQG